METEIKQPQKLDNLYLGHVTKYGSTCGCTKTASNVTCDVGEALFRMRAKEISGRAK